MKKALLWMALSLVGLLACGSSNETDDGAGAGSSTGGTGGAPVVAKSKRPQCNNPDPPGGAPLARADSAGVLTEDSRTMLLFGGDTAVVICGDIPKRTHVGDTWLLDTACGGWTELQIAGPEARARHTMVADHAHGRALVFGGRTRPTGQSGPYTLFNDVWAFDFATQAWAMLGTTGTPPSARSNHAAVIEGNDMLVFGGSTSTSGLSFVPQNDLFALNLDTLEWRQIQAVGDVPPKRLFHAMAADPAARRIYVAHGGDENAYLGPFFKDLYVFDVPTSTWTALQTSYPAGNTEGRIKLGMAVRSSAADGEPSRLFMASGHDDGTLGNRNDLLVLDIDPTVAPANLGPLQWQAHIVGDVYNAPSTGQCDFPSDFVVNDPASFERRSAFAFASRPDGEAFVIFAGDSDCGRLNDAWWFDTRAGAYEGVKETLPGLTCPRTGNPNCQSLCG